MARGVLVEVCIDSLAGLEQAVAGGADRIELCQALDVGGLTPSAGLMRRAAGCGVPVMAMIRPRAGGFVFSPGEVALMLDDIAAARAAGLAGVVLGASLPDGRLDGPTLARLAQAADGMDLTLHRAIDLCPDPAEAVETAVSLRFARILTSGGAARATDGIGRLAAMIAAARGRISIMPGSGVSAETVAPLLALGVTEVHGSCAGTCAQAGAAVDLGFAAPLLRQTEAARVAALRAAVSG